MATTTLEPIGQPIRSLQTMLRAISKYDQSIHPVIPDGIYSKDTVRAVTTFQQRHALPVTGITDIDTWYAVVDVYRTVVVEIGPAEPVSIVLQRGQTIAPGETNQHLYLMHGMLRAIGNRYPSMPAVSCSNVHDEASVAAIQWLQTRAGLPPTGSITRSTWRYLARLYRITVGDGTASQPHHLAL